MKLFKKQIIGCTIISSIVGQMVTLSAMGVWIGIISVATPFERAIAATNRFENIKNKYQTDDPNNNRGDDAKLNQTMTKYRNQQNSQPNLENKVIQKYYINNSQNSDEVDLSAYSDNSADAKQRIEDSISLSRQISQGATAPSTNANGAINTQYNKNGVELSKSESEGYKAKLDENGVSSNSINQDEYTSSEINHSQTTFEGDQHYGDETKFYESGRSKLSGLKSGTASDATAYQTIQGIKEFNEPPELNPRDNMFDYGFGEVNDAVNGSGNWMASCSDSATDVTREFTTTQSTNHLCMKPLTSNDFFCEVERSAPVILDAIVYVAGQGKNFLTVEYDLTNQSLKTISPTDSAATELNIEGSSLEGFCEGETSKINRVNIGTWSGTSLAGKIDESTKITELQTPSCSNGLKGIIQVEDTRKDEGDTEWILNAQVRYRFTGQVGEDKQYPEGCYDAVDPAIKEVNGLSGLGSPFNNGTVGGTVNDGEVIDEDGNKSVYPYSLCRFDSYTNMIVNDAGLPQEVLDTVPPWYEGDTGNKTWRVNLKGFTCDPTGGYDYCVVTKRATDEELAQGMTDETECYSWDEIKSQPNQCADYEADSQCKIVSETCAEGWGWDRPDGQSDLCFAQTVEYQCDEDTTSTVTSQVTSNSCAATLPCIGGDCETANSEVNDQFADALAMASVIQHMEDGMNCTDPSDPSTCTIFEGEGKFCSWEPTGLGNDCCEAPDGINIYDYAQAAYGMLQGDAFIAGLDGTSNAFVGSYQSLRQPIADAASTAGQAASDAWGAATSAFTDVASSAAGTTAGQVTDTTGAAVDIFSDQAIEQLQQQAMNYVRDSLPDALSDALFETLAEDTASNAAGDAVLSEGATQAVSILGYAYGAYMVYQYIKLALNLLTACHEYEMDMGVRIATKQCIKVDNKYCAKDGLGICYSRRQDYCCYDSILSRIIMEQASPMLGHDLKAYSDEKIDGSKLRSCPGLTPDQLSNLDWNKIDLSEWISIMIESGIADFEQDVDKLTGSGRMLNNTGRESAIERTKNRANEASLADRAVESRKLLDDDEIDCSIVPRPLACYYK